MDTEDDGKKTDGRDPCAPGKDVQIPPPGELTSIAAGAGVGLAIGLALGLLVGVRIGKS